MKKHTGTAITNNALIIYHRCHLRDQEFHRSTCTWDLPFMFDKKITKQSSAMSKLNVKLLHRIVENYTARRDSWWSINFLTLFQVIGPDVPFNSDEEMLEINPVFSALHTCKACANHNGQGFSNHAASVKSHIVLNIGTCVDSTTIIWAHPWQKDR